MVDSIVCFRTLCFGLSLMPLCCYIAVESLVFKLSRCNARVLRFLFVHHKKENRIIMLVAFINFRITFKSFSVALKI